MDLKYVCKQQQATLIFTNNKNVRGRSNIWMQKFDVDDEMKLI